MSEAWELQELLYKYEGEEFLLACLLLETSGLASTAKSSDVSAAGLNETRRASDSLESF